jgi:hypothetical protein
MNLSFIDRIWRVRGSLALETPHSPADAFEKLDPLFQAPGTSYEIDDDTLTFNKHNPAAQDKLATFTRGTLRVVEQEGRSQLTYDLFSPALLAVFLAPLLFLAFAQLTIIISDFESTAAKESEQTADEEEKEDEADKEIKLHPIDVFLGSPAPEKPDEEEDEEEEDGNHSPTTAYVFAAIFAALYIAGRILEPWLIRSSLSKQIHRAADSTESN